MTSNRYRTHFDFSQLCQRGSGARVRTIDENAGYGRWPSEVREPPRGPHGASGVEHIIDDHNVLPSRIPRQIRGTDDRRGPTSEGIAIQRDVESTEARWTPRRLRSSDKRSASEAATMIRR